MKKSIGIYIHIPFCVRKCKYCDFLSFAGDEEQKKIYTDTLIREIKNETALSEQYYVDTVFIGGGTPSVLSSSQMSHIVQTLTETFELQKNAEISLECNPGTADESRLSAFRRMGINRISIGVQSANDSELNMLGRIHTFSEAKKVFMTAREVGFKNINIDLMSGIPGQTSESYKQSLDYILALEPEHISAYSLIVEEGTPFYDLYHDNPPVSEEIDRAMYAYTKKALGEKGYQRYEISNYSKEGYQCRHNLKYWSGEDYIGFGLGASSKIGSVRYKNESEYTRYIDRILSGKIVRAVDEQLSVEDEMAEFFILGLRKMEGVSLTEFEHLFESRRLLQYEEPIQKFMNQGLLVKKGDRLFLSDHGIDVSNIILREFL